MDLLPYNTLTYNTLMVIGIVTIPIAIALSYLFFKVYRYQRSITLLGLPVGFLFLTISYVFLGAHLVYPAMDPISSSLMWLRVATQTWGFTLIAASYFMANRTQKITKHSYLALSLWSIVAVVCIFALLLVINPVGLSSVYADNGLFTAANLGLLTYIMFCLIRKIKLTTGKVSSLVGAPIAFGLLWLGQLSFLLWDLNNGGTVCLFGSEVTRLVSLALFILIYYQASKEVSAIDKYETK